MMMLASSTPLRYVCIGISPYRNKILAPFATRLCVGCTPSVQVMSQDAPMCAIDVNDRRMH